MAVDAAAPTNPFDNDSLRRILEQAQTTPAFPTEFAVASKLNAFRPRCIMEINDCEADYLDALYDDAAIDIGDILRDRTITQTQRQALMQARLGQGRFREQLLRRWQHRCAVTGCTQLQVLRASHMKPWRCSNNRERLNRDNGLILSANLDALFDRFLVSFADDGRMLVSNQVDHLDFETLRIPGNLSQHLSPQERRFLADHRNKYFETGGC